MVVEISTYQTGRNAYMNIISSDTVQEFENYKPFEPFQVSRTLVEARVNLPNYSLSDNVMF